MSPACAIEDEARLHAGASGLIAAELRDPAVCRIAQHGDARVTLGAISLEQLQPFAAQAVFEQVKPVTLPPGRARLATRPAPTGSATCANTIGTVRVACCSGASAVVPIGQG